MDRKKTKESSKIVSERFVKNLCDIMRLRGKTQRDIVNDLGFSSSTVSEWCNGKKMPRAGTIQTIADYLEVKMKDLVDDRIEFNNYKNSAIAQGANSSATVTNHIYHEMTAQAQELLNIFESLNIEGQSRLMIYAYDLKKEYLKSEAKD